MKADRSRPAEIRLSMPLNAPSRDVADLIRQPKTLLHLAAPVVSFTPVVPACFPERWEEREYVAKLNLFGILPLGRQVISVSFPEPSPGSFCVRDNGRGTLVRTWDHTIEITTQPGGGSTYTDRVFIDAGWLTGPIRLFARLFYAHRQRRLKRLVEGL